jgi:hypothetical protein
LFYLTNLVSFFVCNLIGEHKAYPGANTYHEIIPPLLITPISEGL